MVMLPDVRDAARVRALGVSGMATFYPPHLEAIHAAFTPAEGAVARAREVVAAYEEALARGAAAVTGDGGTLIVQDYERARRVLARAGSSTSTP
jgi:citrate lyase subunit beta/citryl-CoA lyase